MYAPTRRADVLVVDDDEDVRFTLHTLLEDEGYAVYKAAGGEAALARLRAHPCGMVVLLDLNMPDLDGAGVLAAMVADASPAPLRGSAFGLFNLASGIAMLAASALAGLLWDKLGSGATFSAGAGFALAALGVMAAGAAAR